MNKNTLRFPGLALLLGLVCWASAPVLQAGIIPPPTVSAVMPDTGSDTLRVTATGSSKFSRDTEKLKKLATDAATRYCKEKGKHLKVVSMDEEKGFMFVGEFPTVTLVFKAVDVLEADPEPGAAPTDDLYAALLKLDDLRKKGILTDEEFQSEKKKVLNRSK